MHNAHRMAIANCIHNRSNSISSLFLLIVFLLDDSVEHFTSCHELKDKVEAVSLVENLEQLHHIRVVQL